MLLGLRVRARIGFGVSVGIRVGLGTTAEIIMLGLVFRARVGLKGWG
jgi:hypothetical protein